MIYSDKIICDHHRLKNNKSLSLWWARTKRMVSKNRVMRSQKYDFSFFYGLTGSERDFVGSILVPESYYIHLVIIDITLAQIDTEFE